jgi:hypothetical protein
MLKLPERLITEYVGFYIEFIFLFYVSGCIVCKRETILFRRLSIKFKYNFQRYVLLREEQRAVREGELWGEQVYHVEI